MSGIGPLTELLRRSRRGIAADVDEEIATHLRAREQALIAQGFPPAEARAEALRRFGDVTETRRAMVASAQRHVGRARRRDRLEALIMDARYTLRQLRRSPGFTAAVILTLALGIGANAAMFGVLDRLLLRPPSNVPEPDRAGRIYVHASQGAREYTITGFSYRRLREMREGVRDVIDLAGAYQGTILVGRGENARQVRGSAVTANYWTVLGARPAVGRLFGEEADRSPDGEAVVVLGHEYWRSAFGADSSVIGRTLDVGTGSFTIIGVARPGFTGAGVSRVDVWIPVAAGRAIFPHLPPEWHGQHNFSWLEFVGRLKPGATRAQAEAALAQSYARTEAQGTVAPADARAPRASMWPLLAERGPERTDGTRVAMWVGAVSLVVLLLACVNVANLLLARALQRRSEIAVRLALGVSRGRLTRQLLLESLVLAIGGALAGLVLAWASSGVLYATLFPGMEIDAGTFDRRLLAFAGMTAMVACVLSGLGPALYATRADLRGMLSGATRVAGHRSALRAGLLVGQAALSTMLLVGAGLFVRSLAAARATDLGFDADHLLVVRIQNRSNQPLPGGESAMYQRFVEALRSVPGVTAATTTMQIPFSTSTSTLIDVPGVDSVQRFGDFRLNGVGDDFFETTGTRILQGRALNRNDRAGSPLVMVVSDSMARVLWPGASALGQCVKVGGAKYPCAEVVGVAENVHQYDVRAEPSLQFWFPESQNQGENSGAFAVLARVQGDPTDMVPVVRAALQPLAPTTLFVSIRTLDESLGRVLRPWRLGSVMFGIFGGIGLLIAAVGLYSVLAYAVGQRRRELGVRLALGARAGTVLGMVIGEGVRVVAVGVGIGLMIAAIAGQRIEGLLFGVGSRDPLVIVLVVATLILAAVLASLLPALRATRVDPTLALRSD